MKKVLSKTPHGKIMFNRIIDFATNVMDFCLIKITQGKLPRLISSYVPY